MTYNRADAVSYAHEWAYKRNPNYLNFSGIGGDCTNFISQCILAGGIDMNYKKTFGWYYRSSSDRAAAWSGVQFFYNFLVNNKEDTGPVGREISMGEIVIGDVIQLSFDGVVFTHSLFVVDTGEHPNLDNILIATHSIDSDYREVSSYPAVKQRFLRIEAPHNQPSKEKNPSHKPPKENDKNKDTQSKWNEGQKETKTTRNEDQRETPPKRNEDQNETTARRNGIPHRSSSET